MMLMSIRVFLGLVLFVGLVSGKPADKPLMLKGSVVDEEGRGIARPTAMAIGSSLPIQPSASL